MLHDGSKMDYQVVLPWPYLRLDIPLPEEASQLDVVDVSLIGGTLIVAALPFLEQH